MHLLNIKNACIKKVMLAGLLVCIAPVSTSAAPTIFSNAGAHANARVLLRTFAPQKTAHHLAEFGLSRDDMVQLFAIGNDIEIYVSPEGVVYPMGIGFADLEDAQTWVMPGIAFEGPGIWQIVDPQSTPYGSTFPTATHALLSDNTDINFGKDYFYFEFSETQLLALGGAIEPPDNAPPETYLERHPLALFPLDETMSFSMERSVLFENLNTRQEHVVAMHGFGDFVLGDTETIKAGAFIDDIVWRDPNETHPDSLLAFTTHYSILGEDGTWFRFYIAAPPDGSDLVPIAGDVFIEEVELWRIVPKASVALEEQAIVESYRLSAAYPNPFNPQTQFTLQLPATQAVTVGIYDLLGRQVAQLHNGVLAGQTTHTFTFEASDQPSGMYLIQVVGDTFHQTRMVTLLK